MNKTAITTIIIYTIILLFGVWFFFNTKSNYDTEINQLKNNYKLKYDSLENNISSLNNDILKLDTVKLELKNKIDSIKNNQNDNETPKHTSFHSLDSDDISNLFTGYNTNKHK